MGDVSSLRKLVTLTPEIAKRYEDYRWNNRFKTDSAALRRLIEMGLDAHDLWSKAETGGQQ